MSSLPAVLPLLDGMGKYTPNDDDSSTLCVSISHFVNEICADIDGNAKNIKNMEKGKAYNN